LAPWASLGLMAQHQNAPRLCAALPVASFSVAAVVRWNEVRTSSVMTIASSLLALRELN
jgi:hypothetical protein